MFYALVLWFFLTSVPNAEAQLNLKREVSLVIETSTLNTDK